MRVSPTAAHRAAIDGKEFEQLVAGVLRQLGADLDHFRVVEQEAVSGADGVYRIDITARFTAVGAHFLVLVECKDHRRPVEREEVQILADKTRSAGAQKAMLFSTNGFQSGAIEYAHKHGIALVRVLEGTLTWETRGSLEGPPPPPPAWVGIPRFVAQHIRSGESGGTRVTTIRPETAHELLAFFADSATSAPDSVRR